MAVGNVNFLPPFLPLKRWPELEIRAFGDLNGDTHPDVIWQHTTTGQHAVWLFSGTTLLPNGTVYIDGNPDPTATSYVEPDLNWKIMAAADMDQEGQTDLVWQHLTTGYLRIWHMNGREKRTRWMSRSTAARTRSAPTRSGGSPGSAI